mmetsp:Transcript_10982/g.33966  ORF Transcript_10982/g.33966 Transcript_10982/m.33966 type:complete len:229 (-) Transcript_10982:13-699(-)
MRPTRWREPRSATIPTWASLMLSTDSFDANRKSHAEERSTAPPKDRPCTDAMTGTRHCATDEMAACHWWISCRIFMLRFAGSPGSDSAGARMPRVVVTASFAACVDGRSFSRIGPAALRSRPQLKCVGLSPLSAFGSSAWRTQARTSASADIESQSKVLWRSAKKAGSIRLLRDEPCAFCADISTRQTPSPRPASSNTPKRPKRTTGSPAAAPSVSTHRRSIAPLLHQ